MRHATVPDMQFGADRKSRRELGDINVTSLVDVIFNLTVNFKLD